MKADVAEQYLEMARRLAISMAPVGKEAEYVSAAYYGIVWALANAERRSVVDMFPWIRANIYRAIQKHRMFDHLIRIPAESQRQARLRGSPIPLPQFEELTDIAVMPSNTVEVMELLSKSAEDQDDQTIINLRIEGYNDPEIARKLSRSVSYVHKRRILIKIRYECLRQQVAD